MRLIGLSPRNVVAFIRRDLSEFDQFEPERLDLPNDAEYGGAVLERAGEHGVAAFQLRRHRWEGRQRGCPESASNPDHVQARQRGHAVIVRLDLVSRLGRDPVIRADPGREEAQLARAVGLTRTTYWRLETGQVANPKLRMLVNLAIALGCRLEDLIEDGWREWYPFDRSEAAAPPEWASNRAP